MLPQFWLLSLLAPLALGVPVPRESATPSVTYGCPFPDIRSPLRWKMPVDHANKMVWRLKHHVHGSGSNTTVIDKTPLLGGSRQ